MERLPPFPVTNPELLDEWNYEKNGDVDPYSITAGSTKRVWWKCRNKQHEWEAIVCNRTRKGRGCPKCSTSDSFGVSHPHLLKEWHPTRNEGLDPDVISSGSAKRVWWICKNGHEWVSSVTNRTHDDAGCARCRIESTNLEKNFPDVAKEWHYEKNAPLTPRDVTEKSGKKVWWQCDTCLHEWQAIIKNRTHLKSPCPLCSKNEAVLKAKENREKKLDEGVEDYSYDIDDRLYLNLDEMHSIFRDHLRIDSEARSIESLFSLRTLNKIDSSPYYQRNYVWDRDKATYLIESIILGTEIPPLVFFESPNGIEIIDGKQRFESIKRFYSDEYPLTERGLKSHKWLSKKLFSELPSDIKDDFFDTKIRIVKYSVIDAARFSIKNQDLLKKEIFRRYNSGITPLKRVEVDKAIYIEDEPTKYFKKQLKNNKSLHSIFTGLFFDDYSDEKLNDPTHLEKSLQYIRFLLVIPDLPVLSTRNKTILDQYYEFYSDNYKNVQPIYSSFLEKVKFITKLNSDFKINNYQANKYFWEVIYWLLSILYKEGINTNNAQEDLAKNILFYFEKYKSIYLSEDEKFFYKSFIDRFSSASTYFGEVYGIDLSVYVTNRDLLKEFKQEYKESLAGVSGTNSFERIERQEAIPYSIDDLCRMMNREKFLVRPAYQRTEVINTVKSSSIIESILLGIKLPPLYVFKREDGVHEVIDGQQRILSILGYMRQEFIDLHGKRIRSNKDGYKLTKLNILSDLNGKSFDMLTDELKEKIWDFSLALIVIDQKINEGFDPVDLYIRINSRPFPIKENTFEMWNSYIDKKIIDSLKYLTSKYGDWFYLTKNSIRMKNEELIAILCCMEYLSLKEAEKSYDFMGLFERQGTVSVRLKEKNGVTKILNLASIDESEQIDFNKSIKAAEGFIKKLKLILILEDAPDTQAHLSQKLTETFNTKNTKYYARKLQDFYALWYVLHGLNLEMMRKSRENINRELSTIIQFMKDENPDSVDDRSKIFRDMVQTFKNRYATQERKIRLSSDEVKDRIREQNNICPLCRNPLYIGDAVEIDHIEPLSRGGSDGHENLQVVHEACNRKKGAREDA